MGTAMLADYTFPLDADSIRWTVNAKTNVTSTIGGHVVQVFGTRVENMTVQGSFGRGGIPAQQDFLAKMTEIIDVQNAQGGESTVRFAYPSRGWDFEVYVTEVSSDKGNAVTINATTVNPKYSLTLFIVTGSAALNKVAQNAYIARLATDGIGWKPGQYNGPVSFADVQTSLSDLGESSALQALQDEAKFRNDPANLLAAYSNAQQKAGAS